MDTSTRLAARLARARGGVQRSWQRAVNEARALYDQELEGGQGAGGGAVESEG